MQVALICKSRLYENILEISNKALTKSSFFFNQLICKSLNYMQKSVIWKKTIQRFGIKVALMYPKKSFHEFPSKSFLAIRGARSRPKLEEASDWPRAQRMERPQGLRGKPLFQIARRKILVEICDVIARN